MWLGKSELTDEHLVRTDEGAIYARSARRLAERSLSEEYFRAVVETQRPKTTIADIPPAAEPLALPREPPEAAEDAKEEPTGEQEENDESLAPDDLVVALAVALLLLCSSRRDCCHVGGWHTVQEATRLTTLFLFLAWVVCGLV